MLKVWGRTNSINVMKALWALDELGLDFERVDAGMAFGVVDTPEYRALNPNGRVPTLQDGDLVLWESNVIVRYLARRYGEGSLLPDGVAAQALADQWMDWQQTTPHADITYLFWGRIRNSPAHQDADKAAACEQRLNQCFASLDAWLGDRPYVAGDRLTMGDIPLGAAVWRWSNLGVERASLPYLEAWHARLLERPAFRERVAQPLN